MGFLTAIGVIVACFLWIIGFLGLMHWLSSSRMHRPPVRLAVVLVALVVPPVMVGIGGYVFLTLGRSALRG